MVDRPFSPPAHLTLVGSAMTPCGVCTEVRTGRSHPVTKTTTCGQSGWRMLQICGAVQCSMRARHWVVNPSRQMSFTVRLDKSDKRRLSDEAGPARMWGWWRPANSRRQAQVPPTPEFDVEP